MYLLHEINNFIICVMYFMYAHDIPLHVCVCMYGCVLCVCVCVCALMYVHTTYCTIVQ
jgi:hypothetical protein